MRQPSANMLCIVCSHYDLCLESLQWLVLIQHSAKGLHHHILKLKSCDATSTIGHLLAYAACAAVFALNACVLRIAQARLCCALCSLAGVERTKPSWPAVVQTGV